MTPAEPVPTPSGTDAPRWFDPAVLVATCGGLGWIGFAPGTFGAAVGTLLALAFAQLALPPLVEAGLLVAINLVGIPVCTRARGHLAGARIPGRSSTTRPRACR